MSTRPRKPSSRSTSSSATSADARPQAATESKPEAPKRVRKPAGAAPAAGALRKPAVRKLVDGKLVKPATRQAPRRRAASVEPLVADDPDVGSVRRAAPRKSAARKVAGSAPARPATAPKPVASAPTGLPQRPRSNKTAQPAERLRSVVLAALEEMKARELIALDVREKTSVCDWFIIVTGTSSRHVKSLAEEVVKAAKALKLPPLGVEGMREGDWVVVDLGDLVVHVMQPRMREFYALEKLWGVGDSPLPTGVAAAGTR